MGEYLVKSALAITFAYLLYLLFMRKGTNFRWHRLYLTGVMFIALTLPAVYYILPVHQKVIVHLPEEYIRVFVPQAASPVEEVATADLIDTPAEHHSVFTLARGIGYVYFMGLLWVIALKLTGFLQLAILVFRHGVYRQGKRRFVFIKNLQSTFSFFRLIFIDPQQFQSESNDVLLAHETVHVRQWHSLDLMLMEAVTVIHWFNPVVWHLKRTLTEVHEFLADQDTIGEKCPPLEYKRILLSMVCGFDVRLPVHGMSSSLTKKRIQMITNNKQNKKWFVILLFLIVAILATGSFSSVGFARYSNITQKISEVMKKDTLTKTTPVRTTVKFTPPTVRPNDTVSKRDSFLKSIPPPPPPKIRNTIKFTPPKVQPNEVMKKDTLGKIRNTIKFTPPIMLPLFNKSQTEAESNRLIGKYLTDNCDFSASLTDQKSTIPILVTIRFDTNGKVKSVEPGNKSDARFTSYKAKNVSDKASDFEVVSKALYAAPAFKLFLKNNKICDELNYLIVFQKRHCNVTPLTLVFHKVNTKE